MTREEIEIKERLRAAYEMYRGLKDPRKDPKIVAIVEEEIDKFQKCDYEVIKTMENKHINFFVNQKMKLLRKKYKSDEKTEEEIVEEFQDIARLRTNVNVIFEPGQIDVFFKGRTM